MNWTDDKIEERNRRIFGEGGAVSPEPAGVVRATPVSKYRNVRKQVDGITFDSSKEARRYIELKALVQCQAIFGLERQPEFTLMDALPGIRPVKYRGDFAYMENGRRVVEDVKGMRTAVYQIKAKLFRSRYPNIELREV